MSDFVDNHEQELTELFDENSTYAGDSDAVETFLAYIDSIGVDDMDSAEGEIIDFDDKYRGAAGSEAEFAEKLAEELGDLTGIPDYIKSCIDWEDVWGSWLCHDVDSYELAPGKFGFVWA